MRRHSRRSESRSPMPGSTPGTSGTRGASSSTTTPPRSPSGTRRHRYRWPRRGGTRAARRSSQPCPVTRQSRCRPAGPPSLRQRPEGRAPAASAGRPRLPAAVRRWRFGDGRLQRRQLLQGEHEPAGLGLVTSWICPRAAAVPPADTPARRPSAPSLAHTAHPGDDGRGRDRANHIRARECPSEGLRPWRPVGRERGCSRVCFTRSTGLCTGSLADVTRLPVSCRESRWCCSPRPEPARAATNRTRAGVRHRGRLRGDRLQFWAAPVSRLVLRRRAPIPTAPLSVDQRPGPWASKPRNVPRCRNASAAVEFNKHGWAIPVCG